MTAQTPTTLRPVFPIHQQSRTGIFVALGVMALALWVFVSVDFILTVLESAM